MVGESRVVRVPDARELNASTKTELDPKMDFIAGTIAGKESKLCSTSWMYRFILYPGVAGLTIAHPFDTGENFPPY